MTTRYVNYELFFDAAGGDDIFQLNALREAVTNLTDETWYRCEEIDRGKIRYRVTGPTGDELLLTERSRAAFLRFIKAQNPDPELDIDEAAAFEYAVNNPHS